MKDQPPHSPASSAGPILPSYPNPVSTRIIGLSLLLISFLFVAMGQLDHPTLTIVHTLTDPLIDQVGDIGNDLGKGLTLILISSGIGAIGVWLNAPRWKFAGLYSLLAHGLSALFTQTIKHSLGRPRPRLMDTTRWEVGPSLETGLDSFPSGHTAASFSVATVLAFYFPKRRIIWFSLAAFTSGCRVIKGSHYPTDILGGLLLGIGSGLVFLYARDKWKEVTAQAFVYGLPWLITAFGLLWVLVPHPGIELEPTLSLFIGLTFLSMGLGLRLWWIREGSTSNPSPQVDTLPTWSRILMGLGLASTTGSLIVLGFSLLTGMIWWLGNRSDQSGHMEIQRQKTLALNPIGDEILLGMGMFLLAFLAFFIRSL